MNQILPLTPSAPSEFAMVRLKKVVVEGKVGVWSSDRDGRMKLWDCFSTALRSLLSNKLRSVLTMLGILIGVAAVISVLSLGSAQAAIVEESFATLGSNLIYVLPREGSIGGMAKDSSTIAAC